MTGALIDWTSRYPGDLRDDQTQATFREILVLDLSYTFMAHLTADLILFEHTLNDVVDLDSSWAITQHSDLTEDTRPSAPRSVTQHSELTEDTKPSAPTTELVDDGGNTGEVESSTDKLELDTPTHEPTPSTRSMSITSGASLDTDPVSMPPPNGGGPERRSSARSSDDWKPFPSVFPTVNAGNDQGISGPWAIALSFVLNNDPRYIAIELTRRQWEVFSAMRVSKRSNPVTDVSRAMCFGMTWAKREMARLASRSPSSTAFPDGESAPE